MVHNHDISEKQQQHYRNFNYAAMWSEAGFNMKLFSYQKSQMVTEKTFECLTETLPFSLDLLRVELAASAPAAPTVALPRSGSIWLLQLQLQLPSRWMWVLIWGGGDTSVIPLSSSSKYMVSSVMVVLSHTSSSVEEGFRTACIF